MYFAVLFIIIIYLLSVFKRKKLYAFYFGLGVLGFYGFVFFFLRESITPMMIKGTCFIMDKIGRLLHLWVGYPNYGVLFIDNGDSCISLNIDYECSGFLEILTFISPLLFFQVYSIWKRLAWCIGGTFYLIVMNIVRLCIICGAIYIRGDSAYYLAHTIVGRLFFVVCVSLLYIVAFTYAHVNSQDVGSFDYK